MEGNKLVVGIFALVFGMVLLLLFISKEIVMIIKIKKLKYKKAMGTVIRYVNTSSEEYKKKVNEDFLSKHEKVRPLYEFLKTIFPTSEDDDEKYRGSTYASVVQFKVDGKDYEVVSDFSADRKEKKNTKHKIMYNPKNPEEAYITNDRGGVVTFGFPILVIIAGLWLILSK